jgi:hypothetical protein
MSVLVGRLLLAVALLGTLGSTLRTYPHQLAYFNELAGGPCEGWRHMLGSSFDWGGHLVSLREWITTRERPRDDDVIGVVYPEALRPEILAVKNATGQLLSVSALSERECLEFVQRAPRRQAAHYLVVNCTTLSQDIGLARLLRAHRPVPIAGYALLVYPL